MTMTTKKAQRHRRSTVGQSVVGCLLACYTFLGLLFFLFFHLDENDQNTNGNWPDKPEALSQQFLLDRVARDQLPIIYPHTFIVKEGNAFGELLHASWPKSNGDKVTRHYGQGPTPIEPPIGATVQGNWPDMLEQLTYIPILKNGHTSLSNAFGDLRQRLNGTSELVRQKALPSRVLGNVTKTPCTNIMAQAMTHETTHKVFTILRDPIDRFISATCEELRQGPTFRGLCLKSTWQGTLTCVLERVRLEFKAHQELQTKQLHFAVRGKKVGVAVIPFTLLSDVMSELGCTTQSNKVRDRKSSVTTTAGLNVGRPKDTMLQRKKVLRERIVEQKQVSSVSTSKISAVRQAMSRYNVGHRRLTSKSWSFDKIQAHNLRTKNDSDKIYRIAESTKIIPKARKRLTLNRKQPPDNSRREKVPPLNKTVADEYLNQFCQIQSDDLSEGELQILCTVYEADVTLLESVGMEVPHCVTKNK